MARPAGTSLDEWLIQEMGPAVGNANIPAMVDAVAEWLDNNNMPRAGRRARMNRRDFRDYLGLD